MDLIKGSFKKLVDILSRAQYRIIIVVPNISIEVAEILKERKNKNVEILPFFDIREEVYREGYGEIKALEILKKEDIQIYNIREFNITFIIIDDIGYFYFPKSRFFEEEGISFDLIPMSADQTKLFIEIFCNKEVLATKKELKTFEVGDVNVSTIKELVIPLDSNLKESLEKKIENNPPLKPNFKRTLNVYEAKFKIAELKFSGANIHIMRVKLPKNTLPINDSELNKTIEASLRLFTNISEKEFFKPFFKIKEEIEFLRNSYFYYIKSRDKNLIKVEEITEFTEQLNKLKTKLDTVVKNLINDLQGEIVKTRERIHNNLFDFLKNNPQEKFNEYSGEVLSKVLQNYTATLVSKIHFPDAKSLVKGIKLECYYYNITWEDLNNKEVIKEMVNHEILSWQEAAYFEELVISAKEEK
jgi:hypothetical protein